MTAPNTAPQSTPEPVDPFDRMLRRMAERDLRARAMWHEKPADGNRQLRRQVYTTKPLVFDGVALQVSVEGSLWRTWSEQRPLGFETARNSAPMPVMRNVADAWFVTILGATAGGVEILPVLSDKVRGEIRKVFVAQFEAEDKATQ
jgi:hypothetical protein